MENHLHLIVDAPDLSQVMQSFKRHTAKSILAYAERSNRSWLLTQFALYKKRYKKSSTFQVWQEGLHPQHIKGDAMLAQKLKYIHENPVRRGYVDLPEHWRYSSARNYLEVSDPVMDVDMDYE